MPRGASKLLTTLAAALLALLTLLPRAARSTRDVWARPTASSWQTLTGAAPSFDEIELRHDRRAAASFVGSGTWRLRLDLPEDARLRFSWAVEPAETAATLTIRELQGGRRLHEERHEGGDGWLDRELDLHGFGAGPRELELTLDGAGARVHVADLKLLAPARTARPNVILYVVDCLRADHVGAYGYARPTTPRLDALARDGALFEHAMACASWTKPSVACLFTSMYGLEHGAQTVDDVLEERHTTLAEAFSREGYSTAAWADNPFVAARTFGLSRGFDRVAQVTARRLGLNINDLPSDAFQLTARVQRFLERHGDERFFLYLHSLDLHAEYRPRPGFTRRVAPGDKRAWSELDLYDGELAANDQAIGELVAGLKRAGLYEDTLIVVTADHGEEFGEHGTARHGKSLFDGLLHVPLIVKAPGARTRGLRVADPVSNLDVAPTLLDLAGLPRPAAFRGLSLRPLLAGREAPPGRVLFAAQLGPREALYAARRGGHKAIRRLLPQPGLSFYDLARDPGERAPLAEPLPSEARALQQELDRFVQAGQAGYHLVLGDPDPKAELSLEAYCEGGFEDIQRFDLDLEDQFALSPDRRRLRYVFTGGAPWRHLVLRTRPLAAPFELRVTVAGRALPPDRWRLGLAGTVAASARLDAPSLLVPFERLASLGEERQPGLRAWYQAGPAPARAATSDPELEQDLRALGYVQ